MAIETVVTIVVGVEDYPDAINEYLRDYSAGPAGIVKLVELLNSIAGGSKKGVVMAYADENDGTEAYGGHVECSQASAADGDTVTILGVVLTARTSPNTYDRSEFAIGDDDDGMCDNLVACVNAHPKLRHLIYADEDASNSDFCVLQYRMAGPFNFGTVATSNATAFAITYATFQGGATGTVQCNTRGWATLHGSNPAQLDFGE